MERINIVGAGWLGMPLGAELVRMGYEVTGTTTSKEKLELIKAAGMKAKVFDSNKADESEYQKVTKCDLLIVTAPPHGGEAVYGDFLRKLTQAALGNGVRKVIYTSATSVYPEKNSIVVEEDAEMIVSSHSGIRLLAMENIFRETFESAAIIIRFGGLFGPDRNPARWLSGRQNVAGSESPVNMIHLDDCIGIIKTVVQKEDWGQTYNAVAPNHPTRREFYARACLASGNEPPQWSNEAKPWKKVSSEKLTNDLGYSFTYPDPSRAF
jgi:nucleoside-diphosphate-sugar epimerase